MNGMNRDGQQVDGVRQWVLSGAPNWCRPVCRCDRYCVLTLVPPDIWIVREGGNPSCRACRSWRRIHLLRPDEACVLLFIDGYLPPSALLNVPQPIDPCESLQTSAAPARPSDPPAGDGCTSLIVREAANVNEQEPEYRTARGISVPPEETWREHRYAVMNHLVSQAFIAGSLPADEAEVLKGLIAWAAEDLRDLTRSKRQDLSLARAAVRTFCKDPRNGRVDSGQASPAEEARDCPVQLKPSSEHYNAVVCGADKHLSPTQYRAVEVLVSAYPGGMSTREICAKLPDFDSRAALRDVRKDEDWKRVLLSPDSPGPDRLPNIEHDWRLVAPV